MISEEDAFKATCKGDCPSSFLGAPVETQEIKFGDFSRIALTLSKSHFLIAVNSFFINLLLLAFFTIA